MTGYEALGGGAALLDLSARGTIRVTGEDRARLLHAMSTNHVEGLAAGQGLYTFFLNDRGRILMDAYIYNLGNELFLDTEPETGQKLFDHLDRFIIADDVTLEDQTSSMAVLGVEGPRSEQVAAALGLPVSSEKFGVTISCDVFTAAITATGAAGFRLFVPATQKEVWVNKILQAGATLADAEDTRIVRLENGVPRYGEEISDRYLVQETLAMHAVNFNKGCYLGQEIVERVRSRGQVHRFLIPVQIACDALPAAGAKLTDDGRVESGELCSAALSPRLGRIIGFAYLRSAAIENDSALTITAAKPPALVTIREGFRSLVAEQPA